MTLFRTQFIINIKISWLIFCVLAHLVCVSLFNLKFKMADSNLKNINTPGVGNGINQSNAQNSSLSESIRQSAENNMNLDTDCKDLNQLN
jgi:hypothetical protein